jgi:transglutaminase-like putative cysteine protease
MDLCSEGIYLGSGTYTVGVYEQISGTSYSVSIQQTISVGISNQFLPFLYPNQQVNFSQNSACVTKAAQICAGKNSDIEKIGAIFTFITSNISYDYAEATAIINGSITSYCPYPDEVLSTRKGICYDYASLFAAMARSQGIPTKLVKGYVGPDGLYHAWNQVYTAQTGWITVEIKINPGFNTLDPTFYSSASNKASVVSHFTNASYYRVYQVF